MAGCLSCLSARLALPCRVCEPGVSTTRRASARGLTSSSSEGVKGRVPRCSPTRPVVCQQSSSIRNVRFISQINFRGQPIPAKISATWRAPQPPAPLPDVGACVLLPRRVALLPRRVAFRRSVRRLFFVPSGPSCRFLPFFPSPFPLVPLAPASRVGMPSARRRGGVHARSAPVGRLPTPWLALAADPRPSWRLSRFSYYCCSCDFLVVVE